MIISRRISLFNCGASALILYGCTAPAPRPAPPENTPGALSDDARSANETLAKKERENPALPPLLAEAQSRTWADKPEYLALLTRKHVKNVRIVSDLKPICCPPGLGQIPAKVDVSFVVGSDGKVEDARVLWSSDYRFDSLALDAMFKYKFTPAEGADGPEREFDVMPFAFTGHKAP
jgi:TonB family protein